MALIEGCAERDTTWINARDYRPVHRAASGRARPFRWKSGTGDDLIGGIYGLAIGGGVSAVRVCSHSAPMPPRWRWPGWSRICGAVGFALFDTQYLK